MTGQRPGDRYVDRVVEIEQLRRDLLALYARDPRVERIVAGELTPAWRCATVALTARGLFVGGFPDGYTVPDGAGREYWHHKVVGTDLVDLEDAVGWAGPSPVGNDRGLDAGWLDEPAVTSYLILLRRVTAQRLRLTSDGRPLVWALEFLHERVAQAPTPEDAPEDRWKRGRPVACQRLVIELELTTTGAAWWIHPPDQRRGWHPDHRHAPAQPFVFDPTEPAFATALAESLMPTFIAARDEFIEATARARGAPRTAEANQRHLKKLFRYLLYREESDDHVGAGHKSVESGRRTLSNLAKRLGVDLPKRKTVPR